MRSLFFIFSIVLITSSVSSQTLFPDDGRVYDGSEVPRVYLTMDNDDLKSLLKEENWYNDDLFPATFKWSDSKGLETLTSVGVRLRGNSSRKSGKKSFKIKFKAFGGEEFYGYSDLNLNGEHNDPSICRSVIGWDLMKLGNVPSPRSNHVALYINNEFRGLYANVEHIDQDYLNNRYAAEDGNLYKLYYGCSFDYKGQNGSAYKFEDSNGGRVYELKTNESQDDYSGLADFITALNSPNDENFTCNLESVFDVDLYLRALAVEVLIGHWDNPSFNKNNAYLYDDPLSGQIKYIPFDIDNTFGVDWFNIDWTTYDVNDWQATWEPRPIFENLMRVEEYKNKYNFYLNKLLNEVFNEDFLFPKIDLVHNVLTPFVENDTYYPLTYGFTLNDFDQSFNFLNKDHVKEGLKSYTTKRATSAISQLTNFDLYPIIDYNSTMIVGDDLVFSLKAENETVKSAICNVDIGGGFLQLTMKDDGSGFDQEPNDNVYTTSINIKEVREVQYFFELESTDNITLMFPKCENITIDLNGFEQGSEQLFINEFMASNSMKMDAFGETDDWIELYNGGDENIDQSGLYLTDNIDEPLKWALHEGIIGSKSFKLFWADSDEEQGDYHTNFKLDKEGEFIGLFREVNNTIILIDSLSFVNVKKDVSYGLIPDGVGEYIQLNTVTPGVSNLETSSTTNQAEPLLALYPNPTEDLLNIDLEYSTKEPIKYSIYSANGKLISEEKELLHKSLLALDVSNYYNGLYFIQIETKTGKYVSKFIKI